MKVVLSTRNLSYRIGSRVLFEKLSFHLLKGEFIVVLGRNGAGKTTLLRHLTGDLKMSEGEVRLFGENLNNLAARELARKRAVLSQSTALSFGFEVIEVVMMGRSHEEEKHESEKDCKIAVQALNKVGLSGFERRNYLQLSGGEQQRVHMARVLAQLESEFDERILFLDEPTSSLDISYQHKTLKLAKDFCQSGGAVFAILHDLNLAAKFADKVLILSGEGKFLFGSAQDTLTSENLSQAFDYDIQVISHPRRSGKLILT